MEATQEKKEGKKSLFASAKVVETKKAAKDEKVIVTLKEADFPKIGEKIGQVIEYREKIADYKGRTETLEGIIKEIGMGEYAKLYAAQKANPGSFVIQGEGTENKLMVLVTDKYPSIDLERAALLRENFGDDTTEEETEYSFNPELLAKYEDVLSELIMGCTEIADEDKPNLITQKMKVKVKKGFINTIGRMANTPEQIASVLTAIQPVIQLKNTR